MKFELLRVRGDGYEWSMSVQQPSVQQSRVDWDTMRKHLQWRADQISWVLNVPPPIIGSITP